MSGTYGTYPFFGGGGGGGGISSINGDSTAAQIIAPGTGISIGTVSGTTTVTSTISSFSIMQVPNGTSPTASSATDTLTFTSSDSTVTITGNSSTKTLNFQAAASGANTTLSNLGTTSINKSLLFVDATYDIGAVNATRPRNLYTSSTITVGDLPTVTTGHGYIQIIPGTGYNPSIEICGGQGGSAIVSLQNDTVGFLVDINHTYNAAAFYSNQFTIQNLNVNVLSGDTNSNIIVGSAALATTATNGFLYIPTCAGAPTGVPTTKTGRSPMIFDTTNNKFWMYNGSWKGVVLS